MQGRSFSPNSNRGQPPLPPLSLRRYRMKGKRMAKWLSVLIFVAVLLEAEGIDVGLTYVQSAISKGASEDIFFLSCF
ncbi:hypothetical protein PIB30_038166 [Stylosanthes scabra]|uniref:Uncharacterized protein n=1 Tax=Stylosanthes scabra TaxID=79078 RepID=A0ABU6XET3_9FABA|nr:hypothetical protein [Stylosanthes scabra]